MKFVKIVMGNLFMVKLENAGFINKASSFCNKAIDRQFLKTVKTVMVEEQFSIAHGFGIAMPLAKPWAMEKNQTLSVSTV